MLDNVRCLSHGEQEATYVSHHIVGSLDTGKPAGFLWPEDADRAS